MLILPCIIASATSSDLLQYVSCSAAARRQGSRLCSTWDAPSTTYRERESVRRGRGKTGMRNAAVTDFKADKRQGSRVCSTCGAPSTTSTGRGGESSQRGGLENEAVVYLCFEYLGRTPLRKV